MTAVVLFDPRYTDLFAATCGNAHVVSLEPRKWIFQSATFPDELRGVQQAYNPASDHAIWVFQAGWLVVKEPDFRKFDCLATHDFGRNILACQVILPSVRGIKRLK